MMAGLDPRLDPPRDEDLYNRLRVLDVPDALTEKLARISAAPWRVKVYLNKWEYDRMMRGNDALR